MPSGAPDQNPPNFRTVLQPVDFSEIRGWGDDDHAAAFRAFRAGARFVAHEPPKTRSLGIDGAALQHVVRQAETEPENLDRRSARAFFERHFRSYRIDAPGFVTGYYEP